MDSHLSLPLIALLLLVPHTCKGQDPFPPLNSPEIVINSNANGIINVVNGDTIDVEVGEILAISCVVEGGRPDVSSVTLTYGSEVETANSKFGSIQRTMDLDQHLKQVTCTAEHVTGSYDKDTNFTINVQFPPLNSPEIVINSNANGIINVVNGDTIDVEVGEILAIQCVVEGGRPDVSSVTLTYGSEVETANAKFGSIQRTMDLDQHLKQVTCTAEHVTGSYDKDTNFTINVQFPPLNSPEIVINSNANGIINVVNGDTIDVEVGEILAIQCVVEGGRPDVSSVTLTYGSEVETANAKFGSIQRTMDLDQHLKQVTCTAEHVTGSYDKDTNFTINVQFPPLNSPEIVINSNPNGIINVVNGDTIDVEVGEILAISCIVEGGRPDVSSVTLTYGSEVETANAKFGSIQRTMDLDQHLKQVTCTAEHVTGSYDKDTNFTINVQFPPLNSPEIVINSNANGIINVVNGDTIDVEVGEILAIQCVVEGGRPDVSSVTLTYGSEVETANAKFGSIQRTMDLDQHLKQVTCTAEHVTGSYDKDTNFTINVQFPPLNSPEIVINSNANGIINVVNGDTIDVEVGEILAISCIVEGGRPDVSSVTLTYGSEVETANAKFVSIQRTMDMDQHLKQVTCTAEHVTGSYDKATKFTINVQVPPENNPAITITNNANDVINVVNDDTIDVQVGEILTIQCVVEGGNPIVSSVTLTYGSEVEMANDKFVSIQRTMNEDQHLKQVTCTAEHVTGSYDKATKFTINVKVPPENRPAITITSNANDVINVVNDDTIDVEMGVILTIQCVVEGGNPIVSSVTLTYGSEVEKAPDAQVSIQRTIDKTHHQTQVTCTAEHVTGSYDKATTFTFNVPFPPENSPAITITNNANDVINVVNDDTIDVDVGEILTIQCVVEGGNPIVSSVTLTYGSEVEKAPDAQVSIQRTIDKTHHQTQVTCTAEHVTGSYDKATTFTFNVPFPPENSPAITITNSANDVINVVNDDTIDVDVGEILTIQCVVEGGNPIISSVTLTYGSEVEKAPDAQVSIQRTIDKTHHQTQVTCTAEHVTGSYDKATTFTFNVPFPPENSPAITITNNANDVINAVNGDTIDVEVGEILTIQCVVEGGNPIVSSVTLTYGSQVETTNDKEVSIQQTIARSHHLTQVMCTAEHVTGSYDKTTSLTMNVLLPSIIQSYTINGQVADSVEVEVGAKVTFECLAEGNPVPEMAIKGVLTNVTLGGEVDRTIVNQIKLTATISSATVWDTDVYVCTAVVARAPSGRRRRKRCADVIESKTKKTGTLVVIGPIVTAFPEDNPPQAKSRPDGRLVAQVEVIANPPPESYTLVKIIDANGEGGEDEDATLIEIPRQNYVVQLENVNCRITIVKLFTVDFQIEDSRYNFSIDNGKGDPTSMLFLETTREADPKDSGYYHKVDDRKYNTMLVLAIVAVIGFVAVFGMMIYYIYWITNGNGKLKSRQRNSSQSHKRQSRRNWDSRY